MPAHPLRFGVLLALVGLLLAPALQPRVAHGQGGRIAPGGPSLQTSLEKGLKARRPVEFQFIAQVVQLVEDGTLPESTVITCFLWARRNRPYRQYPCAYFMAALRNQAAQMGVAL
jgi:hypothetical protein